MLRSRGRTREELERPERQDVAPPRSPAMKRSAFRRLFRYVVFTLSAIVVILSVTIVTSLTVDLGPILRGRAEKEGSRRIHRAMHIGRLSVHLVTGRFLVDDLMIEGLTRADRPFLRARRVAVSMPLSALIDREVLLDSIEMTDWQMLVEAFPNGRHSFPKFTSDTPPSTRKLFRTTFRYVRASRGQFTYEDHVTPWSTVARNLEVTVSKLVDYRGQANFSGGTVTIQNYVPMSADMHSWFTIVDGSVRFSRIDLATDGARSMVTGEVDLAHWPEQTYQVRSRVHFPRMRELFFARERFSLYGDGDFTGTFHLFKGGRELKGSFASALAGVNDYRFPALRGSLVWLPDRLDVRDASAGVYGGTSRFTYSMGPFGRPVPATARFDASYLDVDLAELSDFLGTRGLRLAGRASGRNLLEWPLGHFTQHRGEGRLRVEPPAGSRVLTAVPLSALAQESDDERYGVEWGPFINQALSGHVPIGGELQYAYGPEWVELGASHVATPKTYVEFQGRTAYGERSRIPFHVTSADWQESDRLLVGIMNTLGSSSHAVPIGGRGVFDGVMLGAFRVPRIEGRFGGDGMRAWGVTWGTGRADVVIENSYVDVTGGIVRTPGSEITADGRFSLGYPRRDRGEEINARVRITNRNLTDLRHAFNLDDYPVSGSLSGEFHLYGNYQTPFGFGRMAIANGIAYGEPFEAAEASLRFEGAGVRLDAVSARKGPGAITGAAYVGWNGTYSFNADGRKIPMETLRRLAYPRAPLSGQMEFSVGGSGTFDEPQYDARIRISDLFVADEGVGQVTGRLGVRAEMLTLEMEAASPRLAISGTGRIALNPEADAELTFRVTDTSLDPYVRTFVPRLSPFTTVVVSGTVRVIGELADVDHLLVDGNVEQVHLGLFDYTLQNAGPIRIALDQHTVRLDGMRLVGEGTELDLSGTIGLHDQRIALKATGQANLGILQGFFRDIRSSGQAELVADILGPLQAPLLSGSASVTNGRIRHFSLPHSLEAINGRLSFDARAIRLDGLTAKLGGGDVRFGGRIGLNGYVPGDLNITATGQNMRLRYPEGVRSVVDADLTLRGTVASATLSGAVTVKSAVWSRRLDTGGNFFELAGGGGGTPVASAAPPPETLPVRFDIRVIAPSTLRIENNVARIVSSADLTLRGTYDRPVILGRAEIERGEVLFEGRRYFVTRGTIDFSNPTRIDPFFDVEAETRVRVPGQTYRVTLRSAGTRQRLDLQLSSDPYLPEIDIVSLLFGDARLTQDAELSALRAQQTKEQLLRSRAARLLASPISSEVGRVVEQTFGVDTFQLTPSLADPYQQSSRLSPSARLTIGKRISERVYLTFARSLTSSSRDQIVLLEYDQNDRLSWILTRNEDQTYSLDARVRHTF